MHLVLTGATGLVGSGVLDAMLGMKEITKISILSRRPVQMAQDRADPRVNVILHKDFAKYDDPGLLKQIADADGCVWALGVSQAKVDATEYVKITKEFSLKAAEAFSKLALERQEPFHFVWVSGHGVTHKPGFMTPIFAKVKGETELDIAKMRDANSLFVASSIRPSFIDVNNHPEIKPYIPKQSMGYGPMGSVIRTLGPGYCSPTLPLGQFLARTAMGQYDAELAKGGDGIDLIGTGKMPIVENSVFRRIMGLK